MKHSKWYMIYGSDVLTIFGRKYPVNPIYAPFNILSVTPKNSEQNIRFCPMCISWRLYSLCPNLRYTPRGLSVFWISSFVLIFTISVLLEIATIIGDIKYMYPKMRKNSVLFSLQKFGYIQYKARTGITAEKIIFILLAFQKVFFVIVVSSGLYRPLGGFFVFCISDIVLCVVITPILYSPIVALVILPTAFSIFEHSTKKREVQ